MRLEKELKNVRREIQKQEEEEEKQRYREAVERNKELAMNEMREKMNASQLTHTTNIEKS